MFRLFKKKEPPLIDRQIITRGERAEHLLQSEVFKDVLEGLEQEIWQDFYNSPADGFEQRELLYQHLNVLKNIEQKLTYWVGEAEAVRVIAKQQGMFNEK